MTAMAMWQDSFETSSAVIYSTDAEFRLTHLNRAWDEFALQNSGTPSILRKNQVGRCLLDVIPSPLWEFYRTTFERVRTGGTEWGHIYECSSPDKLRRMHMRVLPFGEAGLLFINTVVSSQPAPVAAAPTAKHYELITMCAHCRRTRTAAGWLWVPGFIASPPPMVSHGLCEVCFAYHYPEQAKRHSARESGLRQD